VQAAIKKAGPLDAIRTGYARLHGMPISLGVMDFSFMGGSMGSVVGEKIARLTRHAIDKKSGADPGVRIGRGEDAEGVLSAHADGQDVGGHRGAAGG